LAGCDCIFHVDNRDVVVVVVVVVVDALRLFLSGANEGVGENQAKVLKWVEDLHLGRILLKSSIL
jgi:hypothetical protein